MGTAVRYDWWYDVGMAFTDDQVAGFVPAATAEMRVQWLLEQVQLIERYLQIPGAAKEQWWRRCQAKLIDTATWYCRVAVLNGIDREEVRKLPTDPAMIKVLTVAAQKLEAEGWVSSWGGDVIRIMREFVTMSRVASHLKKADKSIANKIAHAIDREIALHDLMSRELSSLTK